MTLGDSRTRGVVIRTIPKSSVLYGKVTEQSAILSINGQPTNRGAEVAAKDLVAAGGRIEIEVRPKVGKTLPFPLRTILGKANEQPQPYSDV